MKLNPGLDVVPEQDDELNEESQFQSFLSEKDAVKRIENLFIRGLLRKKAKSIISQLKKLPFPVRSGFVKL